MSKTTAGPVNQGRLKSFVERIEKLREEKKAIGSDEREVFSEAKGVGYDTGTIRWLLKEREVDQADRDERDTLRDTYAHALGMAVDLVRVEGLSQREAAKRTGMSKSSVNRALAVPEVSQTAPAGQSKGIGHNSKRACILPRPDAWKEITLSRDAADALAALTDTSPKAPDACSTVTARAPEEETNDANEGRGEAGGASRSDRGASEEPQQHEPEVLPRRSPRADESGEGSPDPGLVRPEVQLHPIEREAAGPESLGAVARPSSAERVAPNPDDYDLDIPAFLDRRQRASAPSKEK